MSLFIFLYLPMLNKWNKSLCYNKTALQKKNLSIEWINQLLIELQGHNMNNNKSNMYILFLLTSSCLSFSVCHGLKLIDLCIMHEARENQPIRVFYLIGKKKKLRTLNCSFFMHYLLIFKILYSLYVYYVPFYISCWKASGSMRSILHFLFLNFLILEIFRNIWRCYFPTFSKQNKLR